MKILSNAVTRITGAFIATGELGFNGENVKVFNVAQLVGQQPVGTGILITSIQGGVDNITCPPMPGESVEKYHAYKAINAILNRTKLIDAWLLTNPTSFAELKAIASVQFAPERVIDYEYTGVNGITYTQHGYCSGGVQTYNGGILAPEELLNKVGAAVFDTDVSIAIAGGSFSGTVDIWIGYSVVDLTSQEQIEILGRCAC